ncbi:MAG: hypothetical protein KKH94_09645 [Candidatus Omnitrophica bacterium]|nr:hypothetical protein [Candidatus Omnitrophota bacterium]
MQMINSYTEYIEQFLLCKGITPPGEHHFVATYLLPRLFEINQLVPDYINPDGTKAIIGDIVYFKNGNHYLGIEVKFGTIRLTRNEFNNWVVNEDTARHPKVFIGIGTVGLIILSWREFRKAYFASAGIKMPRPISEGYGPQKTVNSFFLAGRGKGYFPRGRNESESQEYESKFLKLLREAVNC